METEDREEIIEHCIKAATLVIKIHTKIMKVINHKVNHEYDDFSGSISDEITDHIYKIMKLTAITWPKEYEQNGEIPFGLLFGEIKSKQVKKEFIKRILQ
ncbi:hypothetical protein HQN89_30060 [Paenibacillus frigoriresistens]|uniref:hypothetical protein n=1 Tax=Paenibacillus alginolyticus TaxID=59839 RepID=UPI001566B5F9|nr:hypothetical protein [Paenibacillus frigoriresistens]NRF95134.1 hypothetical protein [Paenibacillus frigoriresistens]